jgi:hypothetical protein
MPVKYLIVTIKINNTKKRGSFRYDRKMNRINGDNDRRKGSLLKIEIPVVSG